MTSRKPRKDAYRKSRITVGDIQLDCFQSPPGQYYFSLGQMKSQLKILSGDRTGKKYLQPLMEAHSGSVQLDKQIEGSRNATLLESTSANCFKL